MPRVRISQAIIVAYSIQVTKDCRCGRRSSYVHCPRCGSTNFYGLSEKSRKSLVYAPNGDELRIRVFTCKACLDDFNENECTTACVADPTAAAEREQVVSKSIENASPHVVGEVAEYVQKLAARRGVKQPALHVETHGLLEHVDDTKATDLLKPPKLDEGGES